MTARPRAGAGVSGPELTEAGRALVDGLRWPQTQPFPDDLAERIAAVEAEARAPLREALDGCQRTLESIVRGGAQPKGQLTLIVATLQVIRVALADTAEAER